MNNLESVLDDADCHQFFTIVSSVHHQSIDQTLDDGALSFAESLHGISTGGMSEVYWMTELYVVHE